MKLPIRLPQARKGFWQCFLLHVTGKFKYAGYATLAIGTEWIFFPKQEVISPVLCSCDVLLLLLSGFFLALLLFHSRNEVFLLGKNIAKFEAVFR
ncbi:hypothetical protein HN51_001345 [Arachis hypogaea]